MNKVILVGNLTRDPETSVTASGINMCKFGIAVNRTYASQDGEKAVDFFNCTAWRALGENCGKFLTKGSKVAISGRVETFKYEKDGIQHNGTTIVCDDVEFLTPRSQQPGYVEGASMAMPSGTAPVAKKPSSDLTPLEDDGLPF
ncbi:MAG: single-stranded DNA-binding protein [Firmicutes bacterium]|nr:single-stranded DNA-binding protein [Bacillota bacterium]